MTVSNESGIAAAKQSRSLLFWRGRGQLYLLCLLWAAIVAAGQYIGFEPLVKEELAALDYRFELRGVEKPAPEIVVLAIDQRSIVTDKFNDSELLESPMLNSLKSYPFPRHVYAEAIRRLCDAGARVVGIDLLFFSAKDGDQALQQAVGQYRDRVVLASDFSEDRTGLHLPTPVVPESVPTLSVAGLVNFSADADGLVRRARFQCYESVEEGVETYPGEPQLKSFAGLIAEKYRPGTVLPNSSETVVIDYPGPPGTFQVISFYQIFFDKTWERNFEKGFVFRDKIVLIGPGGDYLRNALPTPFADGRVTKMPGVEIHAAALATLLHGSNPRYSPHWLDLTILFGLALLTALLIARNVHPLFKLLTLIAIALIYVAIACRVFTEARIILPVVAPLWVLAGAGVLGIVIQVILERLDKNRVRQTLEKYVSAPVAAEILKHNAEYEHSLGGERRHVTILTSDVRGFTTLSETSDPFELVQQLNEYLTAMVEVVMRHEGTLDKYIGDAILAVYGAPLSAGPIEDALRAVRTAVEMREELAKLQDGWKARGRPPIKIGIGLNSGEAIVGNIGSPRRMEYTVIGDVVNVAARVEGLNKDFGTDILITDAVFKLVREHVEVELKESRQVRGRSQATALYFLKGMATNAAPRTSTEMLVSRTEN
jgi:adenylate cyclase